MSEVNIDFIGNGQSQGEVANLIQTDSLNVATMRPFLDIDPVTKRLGAYISVFKGVAPKKSENYRTIQVNGATLRRDEWITLDDAVMAVAEQRLTGVNDLVSRGLVYNLGDAMGTTVLESHDLSDAMEAELTMDGVSRGKGDRPLFGTH